MLCGGFFGASRRDGRCRHSGWVPAQPSPPPGSPAPRRRAARSAPPAGSPGLRDSGVRRTAPGVFFGCRQRAHSFAARTAGSRARGAAGGGTAYGRAPIAALLTLPSPRRLPPFSPQGAPAGSRPAASVGRGVSNGRHSVRPSRARPPRTVAPVRHSRPTDGRGFCAALRASPHRRQAAHPGNKINVNSAVCGGARTSAAPHSPRPTPFHYVFFRHVHHSSQRPKNHAITATVIIYFTNVR